MTKGGRLPLAVLVLAALLGAGCGGSSSTQVTDPEALRKLEHEVERKKHGDGEQSEHPRRNHAKPHPPK